MSLVFRIPAVVTFRATFLPKLLKNLQFSQLQNFVLQHKSILLTGVNSLYIELILTKIEYLYTQIFWQPCSVFVSVGQACFFAIQLSC